MGLQILDLEDQQALILVEVVDGWLLWRTILVIMAWSSLHLDPGSESVIDHIGLNVPNLESAKSYYDVMMPTLGYESFFATDEQFSYRPEGQKPGTMVFFYIAPLENRYVRKHVGLEHLAFRARTRSQVNDAHAKALELSSRILFSPRLFPQYHESYYASFWFDPHGFLLEIVCNKPEAAG